MIRFVQRTFTGSIICSVTLVTLVVSSPFAQEQSARSAGSTAPSSLIALMRKNYSPENSLTTKFSLSTYWSIREKQEKKSGSIILAPQDRFHITMDGDEWVSDGETMWNYIPDQKQVTVRRLADVDLSTLPSQIFARFLIECPFHEAARENGLAALSWKSDSASERYKSIRLWVREKNGIIERSVLIDRNDNTFTYSFTATTVGKKLSRESFEFANPKHARVIDLRN